jgi:CDP-4-dehydro-6-deoxyglucose reductase
MPSSSLSCCAMVDAQASATHERTGIVDQPYQIVGIRRRTATIRELWLKPLGAQLEYLAGEYVLLQDRDGEVPQRSYSIANAPRRGGFISLLVTRVRGGATSTWVHDRLRLGDEVSVSGPYGTFLDDPAATAAGLYLAAGSGIAPIRSLIEAALVDGSRGSLTLIFSARTEGDLVDAHVFARWEILSPRFRFVRALSRANGAARQDRVRALLPTVCSDLSNHDLFIAGAPDFVLACAEASEVQGAQSRRVHTEAFSVEPHRQ